MSGNDQRTPKIPDGWTLDDGFNPGYIEENDMLFYFLKREDLD